jgi:stage V sporulation protein S
MDVIKVKANSRTAAVAGAIAGVMREHKHADIQAKGYLAEDGMKIMCLPEFVDVEIDSKIRTAVKLVVDPLPEVPEG